ncbi:15632_t:CDS:1 [Dentiscutata erythropus]|uniref:15632_t:CDS:1 n=1 Tax=Dentiscutata erythropus TaxID=1348616 RepID=A0A9N9ER05_9GLOM|nr:15632_t:CDS:1 [Dentiscutata erythropus]
MSNNENELKNNFKMKMEIDNDNNNINNDMKTDVNIEAMLNSIIIPVSINNRITIRKGMTYTKLIRYWNQSKVQKSGDNWKLNQILDILDQIKKRGFYSRSILII